MDWLQGCGPEGESADAYEAFIAQVDTILMGWNTYHQIVTELSPEAWVYAGRTTYVLTHRSMADTEQIRFTDQASAELVRRLRMEPGQDIWICGGASLAQQLMRADLIDRYIITLVPMVLGGGLRLFWGDGTGDPAAADPRKDLSGHDGDHLRAQTAPPLTGGRKGFIMAAV